MSLACKTTPEQKKWLFDNCKSILQNHSYSNDTIDNHSSYANVYLNFNFKQLGQTSHEPDEISGVKYFKWIDFETFKLKCINLIIKKKKICMY